MFFECSNTWPDGVSEGAHEGASEGASEDEDKAIVPPQTALRSEMTAHSAMHVERASPSQMVAIRSDSLRRRKDPHSRVAR